MANAALYEPRRFLGERLESIRETIEEEGWDPILISDPQGAIYPPHRHAAAKLLVFFSGEMRVEAGNAIYECQPGDQLVIPGDVEHAAWVGPDGCRFFWSEQMRGRL